MSAITSCQYASSVSASALRATIEPALLTSRSRPPRKATARRHQFRTGGRLRQVRARDAAAPAEPRRLLHDRAGRTDAAAIMQKKRRSPPQ
ncbi:MAG: hypothetical protein WDM96_05060 [Lacunisphaera sp.]